MRVWLIGLGLIGKEYSLARKLLMANLGGNSGWRYGAPYNAAPTPTVAEPEAEPASVDGADEIKLLPTVIPDDVVEEILKLRTLPDCPNMFDTHAVQRLAFDNGMYSLVDFIEADRKAYSAFILTGKRDGGDA